MKASEMTNEELANELDNVLVNDELQAFADVDRQAEALREAAARLRKTDDYAEMCADAMREAAALRDKLKVAEDAMRDSVPHLCARCTIWDGGPNCGHDVSRVDCAGGKIRRALDAIR